MPGMGDFRRTHACLDSLLQFITFSLFPSTARKTEFKFLHLWLRTNYFALEKKLDCGSFAASSNWKGVAVFPKHPLNSARTVFLQEEPSSMDTTKRKTLKMQNFDTNLQRITLPYGADTTLLQKCTHSLAFFSPCNS